MGGLSQVKRALVLRSDCSLQHLLEQQRAFCGHTHGAVSSRHGRCIDIIGGFAHQVLLIRLPVRLSHRALEETVAGSKHHPVVDSEVVVDVEPSAVGGALLASSCPFARTVEEDPVAATVIGIPDLALLSGESCVSDLYVTLCHAPDADFVLGTIEGINLVAQGTLEKAQLKLRPTEGLLEYLDHHLSLSERN